jgi:hypothetical protein
MKYFLKITLVFFFIGTGLFASAQNEEDIAFQEIDTILNKVILKREISGGAMLYTRGFGFLFRKGFNENAFRKNIWEIEVFGIRGDKQVRVNFYGAYYSNANSYVFGKLNKVYNVRTGLGRQHRLNTKPYWGGVELRAVYYGGLSIGIAKPIHLYIINQSNFNTIESEKYDPDNHFIEDIYGRAPFLDGIQNTRFYPGLYAKAGLIFEFGEYKTSIKALEAGVMIDGYAIPIPIMAFRDKHYYFFNFYVNFTFGKRYNKF